MSRHVFCRDVCLERGEPLAGTGKMAQRHLLVRWPRGKWRVPRFESADMSPDLREAIRLAMQSGAHVALVDRVGQTGTIPQLQSDGVAANYDSEAAMVAAITRWTAGEPLVGTPDTRIIILCCTDSRRDACCARYGFATFKALAEAADPARFNLLQSTHVGGCRFAASLVVLPQRQRYGRVGPEDATAFLSSIGEGQIYLPAFRGRADLAELEQVTELAALQWAGAHGYGQGDVLVAPIPAPETQSDGARLSVAASVADKHLTVRLRLDVLPVNGRCDHVEHVAQPTPRWSVEAVETSP